jgi:hypothetical protein
MMRRFAFLALIVGLFVPFLASAPAHAQATRTWVSGVGDDANPCSRTAPCKTFAGAISKTSASGEIDCLDPGGFGAITITKAITLNCVSALGSILVSGTPGITIAAGSSDIVVIRNLQLLGIGPGSGAGTIGINITGGAVVSIENSVITQFAQQGIKDGRSAGNTKLFVRNTIISHNGSTGISLVATGPNFAEISDTSSINNLYGVAAGSGNTATVQRSVLSGNTTAGVETDAGGVVDLDNTAITGNTTGAQVFGTIRLSNSDVTGNTTGFSNGSAISYGNNRMLGNGTFGNAVTAAGGASSALGQQ